jgi:Fibronectin type III domain
MPVYKDLRAKVGWTRMSHSDFRGFLWKIYFYNVHNPHFQDAPIDFPDFRVQIQKFEDSIIDSETGSKVARAERDNARVAAAKTATSLAHHVTAAADGDPAIFVTSGFDSIATSRKKRQQPDTPRILKLDRGPNSGTINVWLSPSNRLISAYHLRYAPVDSPDGVEAWPVEPITSSKFPYLVSNLTPGVRYAFQASALGAEGWTDFCDPVMIIVG